MMIVIAFFFFILFLLGDWAIRVQHEKLLEKRRLRERETALAVQLKLDFTREAKSLKRVEVPQPAARILCVDDEPVVLDSFRKILVLDGYNVDTVETGQEALGLLQSHHYDFVFTDLRMPAMEGLEVVKAVKHLRPDIDVVIITGYASVESAVEGMKFGAMDYVQKPFSEEELRAFTKKALIRRQDRIARELQPTVHIRRVPEVEQVGAGEFTIPGGVLISQGHSWAGIAQDGRVRVGLDDFAKKLIGRVDAIEFPTVGMPVRAGQLLFTVRQKSHRVPFYAPVSGKVVRLNAELGGDTEALERTPYQKNWVCEIDADNLDVELPRLSIGKAAVNRYQDDLERLQKILGDGKPHVGELELLGDAQWEKVAAEFFRPV